MNSSPSSSSASSPSEDPPPSGTESPSPGTGSAGSVEEGSEPNTVGTLFIMILFLMTLAGMWGIMYLMLLER